MERGDLNVVKKSNKSSITTVFSCHSISEVTFLWKLKKKSDIKTTCTSHFNINKLLLSRNTEQYYILLKQKLKNNELAWCELIYELFYFFCFSTVFSIRESNNWLICCCCCNSTGVWQTANRKWALHGHLKLSYEPNNSFQSKKKWKPIFYF